MAEENITESFLQDLKKPPSTTISTTSKKYQILKKRTKLTLKICFYLLLLIILQSLISWLWTQYFRDGVIKAYSIKLYNKSLNLVKDFFNSQYEEKNKTSQIFFFPKNSSII